jgi:hypothetical protein
MIGNVYVRLQGPTVQGLATPILTGMLDVALEEVASYTQHEVSMELASVLQNPTGYYESQIRTDRVSAEAYSVNDSNVIYGPWLEGIGSRNATTRFKGYATFRRVRNRMAQKAGEIIEAAIGRAVGSL